MTTIEELYQFQQENNKANKAWLNKLMTGSFLQGKDQLSEFMLIWDKALGANEILLGTYNSLDDIFKDCD